MYVLVFVNLAKSYYSYNLTLQNLKDVDITFGLQIIFWKVFSLQKLLQQNIFYKQGDFCEINLTKNK